MKQSLIVKTITSFTQFLALYIFVFSSFSYADSSLYERAQHEELWKPSRVEIPGFDGSITGYFTHKGNFRIEELSDLKSKWQISGGTLTNYRTETDFLQNCEDAKGVFDVVSDKKNLYKLRGPIYPLAKRVLQFAISRLVSGKIETTVWDPQLDIQVQVTPSSYVQSAQVTSIAKINQSFRSQLREQMESIVETGEVTLTFNGHLDLACDFVAGNASLQADYASTYNAAKVLRTPQIEAEQIGQLYARQQKIPSDDLKSSQRFALAGATMAMQVRAMPELQVDTFMTQLFLPLVDLFYPTKNAELAQLTGPKMHEMARSFDLLSEDVRRQTRFIDISTQAFFKR